MDLSQHEQGCLPECFGDRMQAALEAALEAALGEGFAVAMADEKVKGFCDLPVKYSAATAAMVMISAVAS